MHAFTIVYLHGVSIKTTAYLSNINTLNLLTRVRKRTSETFLSAVANNEADNRFVVNMQ